MSPRIVLFGASGYTGELTARELVRRGARPLLAARNSARLKTLATELGGLETHVADLSRPESLRALVGKGDVLISTVGPFARWGDAALQAAVRNDAHYLDSTGEAPFIRRVFEEAGPLAERAGTGLLTAMGYDYLPGNLAGALALRDAGAAAARVEIGYFWEFSGWGGVARGMSSGTQATVAQALLQPMFTRRSGRIVTERGAKRVHRFEVTPGHERPGISIGSSEQFTLPRLAPDLKDVDVYLGWFGTASRPMQALSAATEVATKIPGVGSALTALVSKLVTGSRGGPSADARAGIGSLIVADAYGSDGEQLSHVRLRGPNAYDLTAAFLAWGAERVASGGLKASGALGPVDGFGLGELEIAAAQYGLVRS